MAGLLSYVAAGAVAGVGKGLVERAAAIRDAAIASQKERVRLDERAEDRQWKMEDRAADLQNRITLKGMSGGRGGGGSGGSSSDGSQYIVLTAEEKKDLGLPAQGIYQRNRKSGNITKLDEGEEVSNDPSADVRKALRDAGVKLTPGVEADVMMRVNAGEAVSDVISDLAVEEEVTNPGGTMIGRITGWTDEDAPPDATKKVAKGFKPNPDAPPTAQTEGPSMAAPGMPKVGDVVEGYRFLGGDPNDQKSWVKV